MAKNPLFYGTGIDGKKYGFRARESAYPSAITTALGLTKLSTSASPPSDVTILPDNQVKGFFVRVRISLQNGKSLSKFCAANKAGSLKALNGLTTNGSKIVYTRFTA